MKTLKIQENTENRPLYFSADMEKIVEQGILYDFYGPLLTEHQQQIYEQVVYHDLSLNEIAEEQGVSKQAVHDLMRRTTAQMQSYESRLHLIEKFRTVRGLCDEIIEKSAADGGISDLAEKIKAVL